MQLDIELFEDGGIRVTPPDARAGLCTRAELDRWLVYAVEHRVPVGVRGPLDAPPSVEVVRAILEAAPLATIAETPPDPWPHDWSTLQYAAACGVEPVVTDLVERVAVRMVSRGNATPYRLAMRGGHVDVLVRLRRAGASGPTPPPPPGSSPDTVVMRMFFWPVVRWFGAVPILLGVAAGPVFRSWGALLTGVVIGVANLLVGALIELLTRRTNVAVDGPHLYTRRLWRWRGPVDLRALVAVGYRPTAHWRSPILLRLANHQGVGDRFGRRTRSGFDGDLAAALDGDDDVRVFTVYMATWFLVPGLARYVGRKVEGTPAQISATARPVLSPTAHAS